jgi:hypothetical protein
VAESFAAGFRWIMLIAAVLALASAGAVDGYRKDEPGGEGTRPSRPIHAERE